MIAGVAQVEGSSPSATSGREGIRWMSPSPSSTATWSAGLCVRVKQTISSGYISTALLFLLSKYIREKRGGRDEGFNHALRLQSDSLFNIDYTLYTDVY